MNARRDGAADKRRLILDAAIRVFARTGYYNSRVSDIAREAGIASGTIYLYFKTKEALFKAVVKSVITPHFDAIRRQMESTDMSSEEFLKGPFLAFIQELVLSRRAAIARLMIAEGPKHPELTAFYFEHVISHGIEAMRNLIDRGVARGEFRPTQLREFPQLLIAPVLTAVLWRALFERHRHLDTDKLLETHIGLIVDAIRAPRRQKQGGGEKR